MKTKVLLVAGIMVLIHYNSFSTDRLIKFQENKGQWHPNVVFKADISYGGVFFEKNCFTFDFYSREDMEKIHEMRHRPDLYSHREVMSAPIRRHAYKVWFLNSYDKVGITGKDKQSYYTKLFHW